MPVVVVASFTAKPESVDTVRAACKKAIAAVHDEPGCQLYSVHEADRTFVFVEQWENAEALVPHRTAEHMKAFGRVAVRCMAAPPKIEIITPEKVDVR